MASLNSTDVSLLLLTAGLLLIHIELNRPGTVLPGAVGLAILLLATARVLRAQFSISAGAACILGLAILVFSTRTRARLIPATGSTAALVYGFRYIAPQPQTAHAAVAWPCALALGLGTSLLTTIAARARQNKGLDLKRKAPRAPGASPF